MATKIVMRRKGLSLVPVNASEAENLDQIPFDRDMVWTGTLMRSSQHHRFFFGLIGIAWDAMGENRQELAFGGSRERFRKWLTCKAGHAYTITVPPESINSETIDALARMDENLFFSPSSHNMILIQRAKSLEWGKLDQVGFLPLCNKVVDIIVKDILPGTKRRDLLREVEKMVGIKLSDLD